ncbi:MAG: AraC family transcriptional regulator [Myxococcales bacterium FL481]|nr:MAG: AraC family transcriptional regulator [Myxococcales bacterium FL481]
MATIAARAMFPVFTVLREAGIDIESFLRRGGFEPSAFEDGDRRLPVTTTDRLWAVAGEVLREPELGLRVASRVELGSYGLLTYLIGASRTWGEAMARLCRYYAVLSDGVKYSVARHGRTASVRVQLLGRKAVAPELEQFTVAVTHQFGRRFCVGSLATTRICFRHPPHAATAVASFFGVPVEFNRPWNGFEVLAEALDLPLVAGDAGLAEILETHAQVVLGAPRARRDDEVRIWLADALRTNARPSASGAAAGLGMSSRTLRRRLAERGTTFQAELDAVRVELAKIAVLELELPAAAARLGFASTSSFSKAFRRWTGMPPGAFRSAWLGEGPAASEPRRERGR